MLVNGRVSRKHAMLGQLLAMHHVADMTDAPYSACLHFLVYALFPSARHSRMHAIIG
jgi:hypothetical protein